MECGVWSVDLPSDGGSVGQAELCDGDGEPHHGDGGGGRPAVHLHVYWRVRQSLGQRPDTTTPILYHIIQYNTPTTNHIRN